MSKIAENSVIETQNISKIYKSKNRKGIFRSTIKEVKALDNISFNVEKGEIFGLLGPNGAGKTTLIKILTTLLSPSSGTAKINGFDLTQENMIKASIGAMLMGERGLYWKLSGKENLEYFGALYHVPRKIRRDRIKDIASLLELEDILSRTVETYSSGQKMKMVFARALINDAPILMLDEPTNTLDVKEARRLRKIVRDQCIDYKKTIIYCSHIMSEVEELCNRIAIIDHGKIIALDAVDSLKEDYQKNDIIHIEGTLPEPSINAVRSLEGVISANMLIKKNGTNGSSKEIPYLNVTCNDSRGILSDIISKLNNKGAIIQNIDRKETTLEDVFVAKTGRSLLDDTSKKSEKS